MAVQSTISTKGAVGASEGGEFGKFMSMPSGMRERQIFALKTRRSEGLKRTNRQEIRRVPGYQR
jgi:hypothetical protein